MEVPTAQRLAQGREADTGDPPPLQHLLLLWPGCPGHGSGACRADSVRGGSGRRHSGWLRLGPESTRCDPAATRTSPETQLPLGLWEKLGWGSGERGGLKSPRPGSL